jgi:CheY-like chemotaxis protein
MINSDNLDLINSMKNSGKTAMEYDMAKYRLISDALGIALWDMDIVDGDPVNPNNRFIWSHKFRAMLGFEDDNDFPNILSSWSERLHPDDKERVLSAFEAHLADKSGKTPYDVTYRLCLKNDSYRYFHAHGVTLRNDGGALMVAGTLKDVHDTVVAQEALKNRVEFLSAISHDIRIDMNTIIGMTTIARKTADTKRKDNALAKVENAAKHLLGIISDALNMSAAEVKKMLRERGGKSLLSSEIVLANEDNSVEGTGEFSGKKILLVEDLEVNREVLIQLLGGSGLVIDAAQNGREAFETIKANPQAYDLVFMDLQMPEMDGLEATRLIRQFLTGNNHKRVPIVAMTGNVFKEDIENCINAGMDDHIGKPVDIDTVLMKLRTYLHVKTSGG